MTSRIQPRSLLLAAGAALALTLLPSPVRGQQGIVVENFRVVPEHFEPPFERQPKSLLEGTRAVPLPGGRVQVNDARLQMFRTNGEVEMVVSAPVCEYEQATRTVRSAGAISVKTADGRFSIAGEGFRWGQTNSSLMISNRVQTVIEPDLLAGGSDAAAAGPEQRTGQVRISSEEFEYGADTGLGAYRRDVRVASTNLLLRAGDLKFLLPMKEHQVHTITAERDVVLDYEGVLDGVHATGEHAVYSAASGLVKVSGNPAWRAGLREGRGDEIILDRTNKVFRAEGHGFLKMPAQGAAGTGFLGRYGAATNQTQATNQFIEIRCDDYELRTNSAAFDRNVQATQVAGGEARGKLTCGRLDLQYAGHNELREMTAEQDVRIEQGDKRTEGEKARLDGVTGLLEVLGNPKWRAGEREGKGDLLRIDTARDELSVRGHGWMRLPAGELGQVGAAGIGGKPVELPRTNRFAEVFANEYSLAPEHMVFAGDVRIRHPQMTWDCPKLTVNLPLAPGAERTVVAEPAVVFELVNQNGQTVKGAGDRAVYTQSIAAGVTNSVVELTGVPAMLQTTNGIVVRNRVLVLDLAASRFIVPPGSYRIVGPASMVNTNVYRLPRRGLLK